jgi:Domain of unknown function (DUF4381)
MKAMTTRSARGLAALAMLALAAAGCGGEQEEEPVAPIVPDKDAIRKETQNGPVKATVLVWPAKPQLSDPIYVRLIVDAEPGVTVDLPFQTGQLGESALGRFRVIDFAGDKRRSDKDHQIEEHTYVLQAQSSGRHRIPPFRLEMQDRRGAAATGSAGGSGVAAGPAAAAGSAAPQVASAEVLTEEIPVEIAEIPVEKVTASLAPARGELAVNPGARAWWWWAALVGVAGAWLAIAVALFRRWRQRQAIARRRSAYDEAVTELRVLEASGAPSVDTADAWFVRLSAIVRRYLEKRYEIRAPELTTEEFLQVALRGASLTSQHRALLATFLECCDRVKFAAYRPEEKESLEMLSAARGFVEDTRLREGELEDGKAGARAA